MLNTLVKFLLKMALLVVLALGCSSEVDNPVGPPGRGGNQSGSTLDIPTGAEIESSTLHLYCVQPTGSRVRVRSVTSDWNETGVTWNSLGNALGSDAVGTLYASRDGWVTADISSLMRAWANNLSGNYGLCLDQDSLEFPQSQFISRENDGNRPWVEVCYSVDGARACDTATIASDAAIRESQPDANFASGTRLFTGAETEGAGENRALLKVGVRIVGPDDKGTIGNRVWRDDNRNGIQDPGEPGVSGVTVQLLTCTRAALASTASDGEGNYQFGNLEAGEYTVRFQTPSAWTLSSANQGGSDESDSDAGADGYTGCISLAAGQTNVTVDAGMYTEQGSGETASIGDYVWHDLNRNGIQEGGEPGLEGVVVRLLDCEGNTLAQTTTNGSGNYRFSNLTPGRYWIRFIVRDGWQFSPPGQGNESIDSDGNFTGFAACTQLAPGENDLDWDAGMYQPIQTSPGAIGDVIWNDSNRNGIRDAGEGGMIGAQVRLLECGGSMVAQTFTNSQGVYRFGDVAPGSYRVQFTAPSGWSFSPMDQGGNDGADSDADAQGNTTCFELSSGETDMTWDAGVYENIQEPPPMGCTWTKDYWANNAGNDGDPDQVSQYLPIYLGSPGGAKTLVVSSAGMARDILRADWSLRGDDMMKLYAELLAARLNIAAGASSDAIASDLSAVDQFLAQYGIEDFDGMSGSDRDRIKQWKSRFERFNKGDIGPGSCGSDDD